MDLIFDADTGLNVEVCGYPSTSKALLKLKHIAPAKIFKLVSSGEILNNELSFDDSGDIDEPLLKQLCLVHGLSLIHI